MTGTLGPGPIVIAGGSGFLGVSLATHLTATGRSIVILSRHPPKPSGPWRHVSWDARTLGDWCRELDGAAGLVNLVGRSVDCIKTPDHQDEILRSRVEATHVLGWAIRAIDSPPAGVGADEATERTSTGIRRMVLAPRNHPWAAAWRRSSRERGKMNSVRASCPRSVRSSCEPAL